MCLDFLLCRCREYALNAAGRFDADGRSNSRSLVVLVHTAICRVTPCRHGASGGLALPWARFRRRFQVLGLYAYQRHGSRARKMLGRLRMTRGQFSTAGHPSFIHRHRPARPLTKAGRNQGRTLGWFRQLRGAGHRAKEDKVPGRSCFRRYVRVPTYPELGVHRTVPMLDASGVGTHEPFSIADEKNEPAVAGRL